MPVTDEKKLLMIFARSIGNQIPEVRNMQSQEAQWESMIFNKTYFKRSQYKSNLLRRVSIIMIVICFFIKIFLFFRTILCHYRSDQRYKNYSQAHLRTRS